MIKIIQLFAIFIQFVIYILFWFLKNVLLSKKRYTMQLLMPTLLFRKQQLALYLLSEKSIEPDCLSISGF